MRRRRYTLADVEAVEWIRARMMVRAHHWAPALLDAYRQRITDMRRDLDEIAGRCLPATDGCPPPPVARSWADKGV